MARQWGTRRRTSKSKGKPQTIYELICVAIVVGMIIYAIVTGTAPENNG